MELSRKARATIAAALSGTRRAKEAEDRSPDAPTSEEPLPTESQAQPRYSAYHIQRLMGLGRCDCPQCRRIRARQAKAAR